MTDAATGAIAAATSRLSLLRDPLVRLSAATGFLSITGYSPTLVLPRPEARRVQPSVDEKHSAWASASLALMASWRFDHSREGGQHGYRKS